jgi:hypothetical protein
MELTRRHVIFFLPWTAGLPPLRRSFGMDDGLNVRKATPSIRLHQ